MLEAVNGFDRLKESVNSKLKKIERKVERIKKKLYTLEKIRIGTSVASPHVPTHLHMYALGGIDVASFFSQV